MRVHRDLRIDTGGADGVAARRAGAADPDRAAAAAGPVPGARAGCSAAQQLLEEVWEQDYLGDSRLVDNCVQRLRAKIEADPATPEYVQTVRGFGYRFGPL